MVGIGLLFQNVFHLMAQSTVNLWWALNLLILVWCLGIRLMNLHTHIMDHPLLPDHTFTLVSWVQYQQELIFHFNQSVRITPFWTNESETLSMVYILSARTLLTCKNWMHPLVRLMPCLLQSFHGICARSVPILITLHYSFLLASNLIHHDARLGHYFCLCHREEKCQPPSWFIIFPFIQQPLNSRLLCHLITSLWILPIRNWSVFLIFRLELVQWLMFRHIVSYLSYQNCYCWYSYLSTRFWGSSNCGFRSAWVTRIHDLMDSAVSKQVGIAACILA